jgi:outer membrane protein assembly factor BamB
MTRAAVWLAILVSLGLTGGAVSGADWPMHRGGPQLQGVADMPAPLKPELAWSFATGKPIKGSAAIAGNRVYFGDEAGVLRALDLGNGREFWSFKTEGPIEATPLVQDGAVYVGSADEHLYALDAATGALRWKYKTGGKILGSANFAQNPGTPGVWILVGSYDASMHCVDAATGKAVWTRATDNYINGTPAILGSDAIVFGGCDSVIRVLRLADGEELRQIDSEAYVASSIAVRDGRGYVGNYGNQVLALDPRAGSIEWKYRDRNFPYYSSAAVTEEFVIIGGRDKRLHCLERATGAVSWVFQTRKPVDGSPVVCGDAVIVGSEDGRLYCVGLADGKERWAYDIGAPVTSSPAAAEGRLVVGAEDGTLYCFGRAIPGQP